MTLPEMFYLWNITDPVSPGQVVVHNNVSPARRLGTRGFRAWAQAPAADLEQCLCGWADGRDHNRVIRVLAGETRLRR